MKRTLLALATLTAFAGVASAQSSVTIFGVLDASARSVKNGAAGELKTLSTDGMTSSRLGLRGIEDLGGGLRAGFWLEGAVAIDVGGGAKTVANGSTSSGQDWQRRSTVSLLGGFGEIRLGRDYTPDFWNHTVFDPFNTVGVASSTNVFDASGSGATTVVRANNTIGYFLPAMGGLYGQLQVAAGEGAVGNKHMAGRLGYAAGPVNIAVAYGKTEVTPSIDWERYNIGASFNIGFMTLMGQYIQGETKGGLQNGRQRKNAMIAGIIPFGASQLKFSYVNSKGDGARPVALGVSPKSDADLIGVGYGYSFSKRTTVYANYGRVKNKGTAQFTASSGGPAVGGLMGFTSTGYEFGLNHNF